MMLYIVRKVLASLVEFSNIDDFAVMRYTTIVGTVGQSETHQDVT